MACQKALEKVKRLEEEEQKGERKLKEELLCVKHRVCPNCAKDLHKFIVAGKPITLRLRCNCCSYRFFLM